MNTLSLRLPESLYRRLSEVAEQEGVSINQLVSSAVAEKMSALLTEEYLSASAKQGGRRGHVGSKAANTSPASRSKRSWTKKIARFCSRRVCASATVGRTPGGHGGARERLHAER